MPVTLNRLTELDAVNIMLATIAESPVQSLENSSHEDVMMARQVLEQASREVQDEGWYFNIEHHYPLSPDENGGIRLPDNILSADVEHSDFNVVTRGGRLYDMTKHTYKFDKPLLVTVKWALPFDELPETAKNHIAAYASRLFQAKALGSETLHQFTGESVMRTRAALLREEVNNIDANFLSGNINTYTGANTITGILGRDM